MLAIARVFLETGKVFWPGVKRWAFEGYLKTDASQLGRVIIRGTETGKATHNGYYRTRNTCKLLILLEAIYSHCCAYETGEFAKEFEGLLGEFHP